MRYQHIITLIWKELLMVLQDSKIRISILVPPVIQLVIFTFAATLDVKNVPIGVLNRDNGEQGIELTERFYGTKVFGSVAFLKGVEEMNPFMDLQKGVMVVSIDEQFSRNLDAGYPATVQLILDGRKSNTAQIVAGYTQSIIEQFNDDFIAKRGWAQKSYPKTVIIPRIWFNPNTLYYWYNIPCLVCLLSMLTCLVVTTQSVARERELGTFDQLLVSPLTSFEIVIGKLIPGVIIGLFEGLFMFFVGVFALGVPFTGSFLLFFLSLLVFVASISGIGLFISSLSMTQQQAMLGTFTFMLPAVLLSGFATPIENMPSWLQPLTNLIPLKYMIIISKGLFLKAMPAYIVFGNLWPLLLIGLFNIVGSGLFFHKRLE